MLDSFGWTRPARPCRALLVESASHLSWAASSAGRALRSQCRGREFDPRAVHQLNPTASAFSGCHVSGLSFGGLVGGAVGVRATNSEGLDVRRNSRSLRESVADIDEDGFGVL